MNSNEIRNLKNTFIDDQFLKTNGWDKRIKDDWFICQSTHDSISHKNVSYGHSHENAQRKNRNHEPTLYVVGQSFEKSHNHYTTPFFEYKIRNLARGLFSLWPKQQYVNLSQRGDSKTQQMQQQRNQMEQDET